MRRIILAWLVACLPFAAGAALPETPVQPVLLWVDYDAGHGQGKPLRLRVHDVMTRDIFLRSQLGLRFETDN